MERNDSCVTTFHDVDLAVISSDAHIEISIDHVCCHVHKSYQDVSAFYQVHHFGDDYAMKAMLVCDLSLCARHYAS